MSLWEYANPRKFLATSERVLPVLWVLAGACLATGLIWGFFFTPDDFRQGSTVKIIYLHVPSALMAINAWFMMLVTSLVWLIRRHHVSALAAKAAAPVGIVMTLIALAPDPVSVLPRLHRAVGGDRQSRHSSRPDLGSLSGWLGLCHSVALCRQLLESGSASGRVIVARQRRTRG